MPALRPGKNTSLARVDRIMKLQKLGVVVLLAASMWAFGAGKPQTFTGEVSDSMCGASHMMEGKKADCARACVGKGSSYALVVGDKVYSLKASDKAVQDKLSEFSGEQAKITGTADGESIEVNAVAKP
jgi:hypothetical protein